MRTVIPYLQPQASPRLITGSESTLSNRLEPREANPIGEHACILLSLSVKTALAWQAFAGTLVSTRVQTPQVAAHMSVFGGLPVVSGGFSS